MFPFIDRNRKVLSDHGERSNIPNIYALGDVANLPTAKTAAAIFS